MNAKLQDDTRTHSIGRYGKALSHDLAAISKFCIKRQNVYTWAQELRFLVYDDEDDQEGEGENESEDVDEGVDSEDAELAAEESAEGEQALQFALMESFQADSEERKKDGRELHNGNCKGGDDDDNDDDDDDARLQHAINMSLEVPLDTGSDDDETKLQKAIEMSLNLPVDAENRDAQNEDTENVQDVFKPREGPNASLSTSKVRLDDRHQPKERTGESSPTVEDHPEPLTPKSPNMRTTKEQSQGYYEGSCGNCRRYPKFRKDATKFRIVKFDPEGLKGRRCDHYVAVSYCWKSGSDGNPAAKRGSYRIRVVESDGAIVERTSRAPDETIDRAIGFAGGVGARLIWLDQECLPQDDSQEHELGIQGMDLVYQRARWTAGLYESIMPSTSHVDSAIAVLDWAYAIQTNDRQPPYLPGLDRNAFVEVFLEFLEMLGNDAWNKRAWILQEAFSASKSLVINIRTAAPVTFHPRMMFTRRTCCDSISMTITQVEHIENAACMFFWSHAGLPSPGGVAVDSSLYSQPYIVRGFHALEVAEHARPRAAETTNSLAFMHASGGPHFGPHHTCSAAVALSFLTSRFNHRPADRLAIVANLCDYEVRLNTLEIEVRFESLVVCLFALAFMNGDMSLLIPEIYRVSAIEAPVHGPSWALPFNNVMPSINYKTVRAGFNMSLRNANRYRCLETGIQLPAYLWDINRSIDLRMIRKKWERHWNRWTCYTIKISRRENESREELQIRRDKITKLIEQGQMVPQDLRDSLARLNWSSEESFGALHDPTIGATVRKVLTHGRLERDKGAQWAIGSLFYDILSYLVSQGETAVANSIWHSIRIDCRRPASNSERVWADSNTDALPDNCVDVLADASVVLTRCLWPMMQLDRNDAGTFSQTWLIDRIMQDGEIWVGNYMLPFADSMEDKSAVNPSAEVGHSQWASQSIIGRQTIQEVLAMQIRSAMSDMRESQDPADDEPTAITVGSMVGFAIANSRHETIEQQDQRLCSRVSTFDVEGPCWVLTPYDHEMERLPRPALRGMDLSCIVELPSHPPDRTNKEGKRPAVLGEPSPDHFLEVLRRVKGMWEIMEENLHQYVLI